MNERLSLGTYIRQVNHTEHIEITHLYSQVAIWYGNIDKPSEDDNRRAISALQAINLVLPDKNKIPNLPAFHEIDPSMAETVARNMLTILAAPDSNLSNIDRQVYLNLAAIGQDVYIYSHSEHVWNVWLFDTRICLPPVAKRWQVLKIENSYNYWWNVVMSPPEGDEQISISIEVAGFIGDNDITYPERARRVILSAIYHCNQFDIDPRLLNGTHH